MGRQVQHQQWLTSGASWCRKPSSDGFRHAPCRLLRHSPCACVGWFDTATLQAVTSLCTGGCSLADHVMTGALAVHFLQVPTCTATGLTIIPTSEKVNAQVQTGCRRPAQQLCNQRVRCVQLCGRANAATPCNFSSSWQHCRNGQIAMRSVRRMLKTDMCVPAAGQCMRSERQQLGLLLRRPTACAGPRQQGRLVKGYLMRTTLFVSCVAQQDTCCCSADAVQLMPAAASKPTCLSWLCAMLCCPAGAQHLRRDDNGWL